MTDRADKNRDKPADNSRDERKPGREIRDDVHEALVNPTEADIERFKDAIKRH